MVAGRSLRGRFLHGMATYEGDLISSENNALYG